LEESGNWARLAPSLSRGYDDVIQSQPSALEILSVLLAQATGFGFYTTTYIIVILLVLLAVFCFYFLVRTFNPKVALLSLPLNVLLFSNVFVTAFTWGNWPFFAGSCMLVLFFWCLTRIKERWIPALGALAMAAVAFGHTSEYLFIAPIIGFMFLLDAVSSTIKSTSMLGNGRVADMSRSFNWAEWKRIAGMVLGSAIIAGYYLIIFKGTFLHAYEPQYLTPDSTGLGMFVSVTTPGVWLAVLLAAGVALGVVMMRKHRVLQMGFVMLLIGFTNYLGTGKRGLETRYLWPIYLSVFLGLLLYFVFTNVLKRKLAPRTCAIISIVLIAVLAHQYYVPLGSPGMLIKEGWQGIEWVAHETPKDATVLYVYGDAYSQAAILFNTQRMTDIILIDDYAAMAQAGQFKRTVQTERLFDHTNALPYRKGLFSFGFHQTEDAVQARGPTDICTFDYFVLDKVSRTPAAAQFNLAIAQFLQTTANFTKAYENPGVLVLKNPHPGGECLGPQ